MGAPYKTVCRVCGEPRDPNFDQARPYWLAPFIAKELAYLRANAETFARLDARKWAGVPDFAPVVDEGYELEDDQEVA